MNPYLLALHVTAVSLVAGTLFLQSLMVVMALRLPNEHQKDGVRTLMGRVHSFIYYPILAVAILTGAWMAFASGAQGQGGWLHWKLVLVVLLVGLGILTGQKIKADRIAKGPAMMVHIAIFLLSMTIFFLAVNKPF